MKKIIAKTLIMGFLFNCAYICSAAGRLESMVTEKIDFITKKILEIEKKKDELKGVYNKLNTEVKIAIDKKISDLLTPAISAISSGKTSLSGTDSRILKLIGIGDLDSALDKVKKVLEETRTQLVDVRTIFEPLITNLSPEDPKKIYHQLDSALENMKKAKEEMGAVRKLLAALEI